MEHFSDNEEYTGFGCLPLYVAEHLGKETLNSEIYIPRPSSR